MAERADITFVKLSAPESGTAVLLTTDGLKLGPVSEALSEAAGGRFARAAAAVKFEGKARKTLRLLAPGGVDLDALVYLGLGDLAKLTAGDWLKLGGTVPASVAGEGQATILLERPDGGGISPEQAADVALGVVLRSYSFDRYKTKKKEGETPKPRKT